MIEQDDYKQYAEATGKNRDEVVQAIKEDRNNWKIIADNLYSALCPLQIKVKTIQGQIQGAMAIKQYRDYAWGKKDENGTIK